MDTVTNAELKATLEANAAHTGEWQTAHDKHDDERYDGLVDRIDRHANESATHRAEVMTILKDQLGYQRARDDREEAARLANEAADAAERRKWKGQAVTAFLAAFSLLVAGWIGVHYAAPAAVQQVTVQPAVTAP